jgi:hypothetical protein
MQRNGRDQHGEGQADADPAQLLNRSDNRSESHLMNLSPLRRRRPSRSVPARPPTGISG